MELSLPAAATAFVAAREGLRQRAYRDVAGVWTIGYGHTGPEVRAGLSWSLDQAQAALKADLAHAAARLAKAAPAARWAELSEPRRIALLSFVFNLGCDPAWTIWKRIAARRYDDVPAELMRFVHAGGRVQPGLVARRKAEAALWRAGAAHPSS